jgi:cytochrome c55X
MPTQAPRAVASRRAASRLLAAALCAWMGVAAAGDSLDAQPALKARGRAALRAMDCARCHGRDYDGWAAPSLIAAVRDGSRERFDRIVLEGDIGRGMPGYKDQPLVVSELGAIYAYLHARAQAAARADDERREP